MITIRSSRWRPGLRLVPRRPHWEMHAHTTMYILYYVCTGDYEGAEFGRGEERKRKNYINQYCHHTSIK